MRLLRVPVAALLTIAMPSVALANTPLVFAPADDLSDDEKIEKAKGLYIEAERLAGEDNWEAAVVLYEQAYYLVPGKHGFAHKVGIAAWKVNDCDKAFDYLTHFIEYGDREKFPDKFAEAEGILAEVEAKSCRTAAAPDPEPDPDPDPVAEENPFEKDPVDEPGKKPKNKKGGDNGLLIGGAALIVLGAAGVGVGGAGAAIASGAGNKLDELSSTSTNTGYPSGDYACRDVPSDQCPTTIEGQLATGKALTYAGFIGGGVLLVTGVALIAVHVSKKKKQPSASAKAGKGVELTGVGPTWIPGGAGAAASLRF